MSEMEGRLLEQISHYFSERHEMQSSIYVGSQVEYS